jgi:hypothetical protein
LRSHVRRELDQGIESGGRFRDPARLKIGNGTIENRLRLLFGRLRQHDAPDHRDNKGLNDSIYHFSQKGI